jgi:hypothetical protein
MSKWHHATLVFAVGSVFSSVMMGSGPSTTTPPCRVQEYDCRTVDGFCVNQVGQGQTLQRMKICEQGSRAAGQGESGHLYSTTPQSQLRRCYCFTATLVAPCDAAVPSGYEKLSSCGTSTGGDCCCGKGSYQCDTLDNSYQLALNQSSSCSGVANP